MLHIKKPEKKRRGVKRFLLINPPLEEPYGQEVGSTKVPDNAPTHAGFAGRQYTYPLPIGLLRIASQLLREGHEIYFLDCFSSLPPSYPSSQVRLTPSDEPDFMLTDQYLIRYFHLGLRYEEIEKLLSEVTADEVFVGCTFTYHNESAHKVIEICKRNLPRIPLTFGGIYPTLAPEVAGTSGADIVFTGTYPDTEDQSLDYDFLGAPPYFILIKGTSGCPNQCAYCAVHKLEGRRFTHRDPGDVFDEIMRARERYGLTEIGIWDSNILMKYDAYLGVILKRVIDSGLRFRMSAPEGLDYRLMTPGIAQDLRAAGFRRIELAVENVDSTYAKDRLNRQNNLERLKKAISFLKEAGFKGYNINIFVIVGLPDQTLENVVENIGFVWSLGCNVILFPFTPIPGTQLYRDSLTGLQGLPLKSLHPSLYACVKDNHLKDLLIDLASLYQINRAQKYQAKHFREVIRSEELIRMLSQKANSF